MRKAAYFTGSRDPKTLMVRDVMEDTVLTVNPQMKGSAVANVLAEQNVGSVPVVEENRTLLGLISEFDLLRVMDEGRDLSQLAAKDLVAREVVTVTEETPVTDVIRLLQERHLIRVPVVRDKTLVGIVARHDILFGYVRATASYLP
jgi:CBS domain-containing protein